MERYPTRMHPRVRPPKVGLKRIDAAIDAMVPLGFSKDIVCNTIRKLLKIYQGGAGWVFIEEASYKLLIDTILEEQESKQTAGEGEEAIEELMSLDINRCVFDVGETSTRPEVMEDDLELPCSDHQPTPSNFKQVEIIQGSSRSNDNGPSNFQQQNEPPQRGRRPCYGWLSSDSEDEGEK